MNRKFPPGSLKATDVLSGRVGTNFVRVLTRLLAAHAVAEKLTALGYQRALDTVTQPELCATIRKNVAEESKHARLVYTALAEIGVAETQAERLLVSALKGPSFAAPRHFADHAAGELDLVMAAVSLDMTGLMMISVNYKESSYAPHAQAAELILAEEEQHELFASNVLHDAAERLGRAAVNDALREWLPRAVNFFGPPGSGFTFDCITYGLKARDNNELAELYLELLERRVQQAGLKMPRLTKDYPRALA
jgi:1,2-phenylacetyl-CoA epoxidase catalytic subunit